MVYFPRYKFEVYRKTGEDSFNPIPEDITELTSIDFAGGVETTKDVVNIKFPNYRQSDYSWGVSLGKGLRVDNFLGIDDEIKLYGYYGSVMPASKDDALIMSGRVAGFGYRPEGEGLTYSVKIPNRTEELLNTMVPYSSRANTGIANTSFSAIKQMVARLNKFNKSKNLFAAGTNELLTDAGGNAITGTYGNMAVTKLDGTAFPTIDYNETWKPTYYNIEKLSSPEFTGDEAAGEYIFYVKYTPVLPQYQDLYGTTINELVWKPKSRVNMGNLVEGLDITNVEISLDVRDVQNLLIVNAGTDRRGAGVTTVAYNTESMGKYGVKSCYYTAMRRVFSDLHKQEINYLGTSVTIDSDGMPSTGYPITMSFKQRDEAGNITNVSLVADDKKEWNNHLREEAKWQARINAEKVLEKLGEPKYSLNADMVLGSNTLIAGDIYNFVVPSYGWENTSDNPAYKLRIRDIQHTFDSAGWTTRIQALEDEKVLSQLLGNRKSSVDDEQ